MLLIMIFDFFVGFTDVYVAGFISPQVQAAVGFVSLLYFFVIIIANAISIGTVALVSRAIGGGDFGRALEVARQSLLFGVPGRRSGEPGRPDLLSPDHRRGGISPGDPGDRRNVPQDLRDRPGGELSPADLERPLPGERRCEKAARNDVFRDGRQRHRGFRPGLRPLGAFLRWDTPGSPSRRLFRSSSAWGSTSLSSSGPGGGPSIRGAWGLLPETIRQIVRLGWPAAMLQIAWNAGTIVLYNILGRLGEASITALAAIANGLRIEAMIFLPAFALNMAASVLIGQNLGAGNPDRAERMGWRIAAVGIVILSLMAVVVFIRADAFRRPGGEGSGGARRRRPAT